MREFITVGSEHINKSAIKAFGRTWMVADHFGTLHDYDLGKRVYLCSNDAGDYHYLQVESNEQRDARLRDEMLLYIRNKGILHGQDGMMYYPPSCWGHNINKYTWVRIDPLHIQDEAYRKGYALGYKLQGYKYKTYYSPLDGKYY
jgi:hypothetical protein